MSDGLDPWRALWPDALAAWSALTLLRAPRFLATDELAAFDMVGGLAAIRLADNLVMINATEIVKRGLAPYGLAILAHEVGHHVYVPGNRADHARMIAAMRGVLTGLSDGTVHLVANLYADLLINDRLTRRAGIDMAAVYRQLATNAVGEPSATWSLYARTCEHLWRQPLGSLGSGTVTDEVDEDAQLAARLIRAFAGDWLRGARRFAILFYRSLAEDQLAARGQRFVSQGLHDTKGAASGEDVPDGLAEIDPSELSDGDDPLGEEIGDTTDTPPTREGKGTPGKQFRAPWQYGQLLEALGSKLPARDAIARYYRERALPNLVPFPERARPRTVEPIAEGYTDWQPGDPVEDLDVIGSVLRSPLVVPGVTTVQRVYGEAPGSDPAKVPLDLDIYVDCSGSMPDPSVDVSYLALAAVILALSALRAGARVQATLWSSPGVFETTNGFLRDEKRLLHVLTGFVSGGTAFPIHVLRDTYAARKPSDAPVHLVVISDDGVDTMLRQDEKGNDGADVTAMALAKARGGGTLVLNLYGEWAPRATFEGMGWRVHAVRDWEMLVAFARQFVRDNYAER